MLDRVCMHAHDKNRVHVSQILLCGMTVKHEYTRVCVLVLHESDFPVTVVTSR